MKLFISKLLEYSKDNNKMIELFSDFWKLDNNNAIKVLFFILDKKQLDREDIFITLFDWVRKNEPNTFYNNISHIVGVPNTKTLPEHIRNKMLKDDYEKHDKILDQFICKDYQHTFKRSISQITQRKLIDSLGLPKYGSWGTMKKLFHKYKNTIPKVKLIVITSFDKQIIEDIKHNRYSEALAILKDDIDLLSMSRHTKTVQVNECETIDIIDDKEDEFYEKYAFIFCH